MLDFLTAYLPKAKMQQHSSQEQAVLDRYISSKNPSTAAEVDYWVREYDRKQPGSYWSNGV